MSVNGVTNGRRRCFGPPLGHYTVAAVVNELLLESYRLAYADVLDVLTNQASNYGN